MTKLKVMHITFDMRIGGTEMVIKNIIEACDTESFDMSLFCIEEPLGPWGEDMRKNGTSIISVARQDGFDFKVISAIRKHLKIYDIDIIHCHQYTPWVYGTLAAIGLKTKIVFTEHGRFYPDFSSWKRRFINPILARMTDEITAISKATKDALVAYEFIQSSRIKVIYNGIAPLLCSDDSSEVRSKYGISNQTLLLGTIARLDPIKNHPMMLKALRRSLDMKLDVKLMLVGDGEMRQQIEQMINDLALQNHVILTGYEPNPAQLLQAFDLYLLTSFSEGTSMTLLEAMSLSKPCIVTNVGGNPEVIKDQLNGIVIESDSDKALADSIKTLIQNPANIKHMGLEGKNRYQQLFSAIEMSNQYSTLYNAGIE
jgi:glycosyltransferase involved in cell wall biosynthesis